MLSMIIQDLRISPLRNFLTSLSMLMGIVAVIAAVLVGTLGQDYLNATNAQLSGKPVTYSVIVTDVKKKDPSDIEELLRTFHNYPAAAITLNENPREGLGYIPYNPNNGEVSLADEVKIDTRIVSWQYNQVYNVPLSQGRWLSPIEDYAPFELVANKAAWETMPVSEYRLSIPGTLDTTPAYVVGVINDGDIEPRMYCNGASLATFLHSAFEKDSLSLAVHPYGNTSENEIRSFLDDLLYDTTGGKIENFMRADNSESYKDVISFLQIAFFITAALLLLTASIGLLNVGLSSLEQRTHELLIRRAIGASRINVALLVIGSTVLLSVIVCAIALAAAYAIVAAVPLTLPPDTPISPPSFPYQAALFAALAAVGTALLSSIIPAVKASRLHPALVLR
ncbi:MAG: ABC transporter permease [Actinomycetaceae bacterium]|nr:ABC transporter permease [Actinomycetaceae bacterium]